MFFYNLFWFFERNTYISSFVQAMEQLSREDLTKLLNEYKDKYELVREERDHEIMRTLSLHDDIDQLHDKIKQREIFTQTAMERLSTTMIEKNSLTRQLKGAEKEKIKFSQERLMLKKQVTKLEFKNAQLVLDSRSIQKQQLTKSKSRVAIESQCKCKNILSKQQIPPSVSICNAKVTAKVQAPPIKTPTPPTTPPPCVRRPTGFYIPLEEESKVDPLRSCINPFKPLPPVVRTLLPPLVQKSSAPAVRRSSTIRVQNSTTSAAARSSSTIRVQNSTTSSVRRQNTSNTQKPTAPSVRKAITPNVRQPTTPYVRKSTHVVNARKSKVSIGNPITAKGNTSSVLRMQINSNVILPNIGAQRRWR